MRLQVKPGVVHVLLGDWNVRLGGRTGDTSTNGRTARFSEIVQSRCLSVVPFSAPAPTFYDTRHRSSTPDFALVSSGHLTMCSAVTVLGQDNGGSDHFPIMVDVCCMDVPSSPETNTRLNPRRIASHLLQKSARICQAYSNEVNSSLRVLLSRCQQTWSSVRNNSKARASTVQALLDDLTDSFLSSLTTSAEVHCRARGMGLGPSQSKISSDAVLADLREQRILLLRQLKTFASVEEVRAPLRGRLNQVNRAFAKRVKALLEQKQRDFYDDLETKTLGEQQRMIRFERNRSQRTGARMLHPERLHEYSQHFGAMFSFRRDFTYDEPPSTLPSQKTNILNDTEYNAVSLHLSPPMIEWIIRQERNGKAAGCSGVSAELMKPVAPAVAAVLSLVAEIMFCTGLCPESFKKSNVLPVPKKANSSDIKDFRPISLTEVPRRIIEKCLALLLKPYEQQLSPMQGGFREHRSTLDQAATLQQTMTARYRMGMPTLVAFLDIKAAYDSVDRQLLWAGCKRAGISDPVIRMLGGMFDHNMSRVVVDGRAGTWFPNHVGLMQGSSLSPFLYALFIDDLPKQLLRDFPSLPLGDARVNSILYADDIALVAGSVDAMQSMLDRCTKFARDMHFHWGTQKCELLLSRTPTPSLPLSLQQESLKVSPSFRYLGITFNERGIDIDACVSRLCESIDKAVVALSAIGLAPYNYPLHIIANHFRVFVRSCGEYALAILPLSERHVTKLETHQYNGIKALLGIRASVSRLKLLASLGLETVRLRYNVLSAKWLYDVENHKGTEFLIKQALLDYTQKPRQQTKTSSFYYPGTKNPIKTTYNEHADTPLSTPDTSQSWNGKQKFDAFCKAFRTSRREKILTESSLPIPPERSTAAKTLYFLGVPRKSLRFALLWICNCVPYAARECARCGQEITKAHLESCAVRSALPISEPGKGIDALLHRAVSQLHAPSALLAVKILYNEVTRAFPPLRSL